MSTKYPIFVKRDLDGFFGLFVDNLVQLLLIVFLCMKMCGMSGDHAEIIYQRILPGASLSILIGNLFYAWQAHRVAAREGRDDVTALPYGINTPSLLIYVFFVMAPVYRKTGDPNLAWQMGLLACFGSGVIELIGSFVAERIRQMTPRAALLSTLAGIAIGFISMTFALQIWQRPLVAMLPMAIILLTYFGAIRFPLGLPGGFWAVAAGTVLAWVLPSAWTGLSMSGQAIGQAWHHAHGAMPVWSGGKLWGILSGPPGEWIGYLSVIFPMGLFNVVGSLQNIESAEAGGDRFDTRSSLTVNGVGTIAASLLGSCFPTTIYIGHPGWKGLGARAGYSTLNGIVIVCICLTGTLTLVESIIPLEAGIAIVLWIGLVITAQAFQAVPREHAPAVAIGLFPAIAAWGATVMAGSFLAAQMIPLPGGPEGQVAPLIPAGPANTMQDMLTMDHPDAGLRTQVNGFLIHGLNIMERGYIFTCMIMAAVAAFLIDGKLRQAAAWSTVAAGMTWLGLIHAYQLKGNELDYLFALADPREGAFAFRAGWIGVAYLLMATVFALVDQSGEKSKPTSGR